MRTRRYVQIEKSAETQTIGEPTVTWSLHANWWGEPRRLGGGDAPAGGQEAFATARDEWTGRYIPNVTPKMRLNDNGTLFEIEAVDDRERMRGRMRIVTTQRGMA